MAKAHKKCAILALVLLAWPKACACVRDNERERESSACVRDSGRARESNVCVRDSGRRNGSRACLAKQRGNSGLRRMNPEDVPILRPAGYDMERLPACPR